MKTWRPDDGETSDLFLGLFSRRGEIIAAGVLGSVLAALWLAFGLKFAAGALVVIILVWTLIFA